MESSYIAVTVEKAPFLSHKSQKCLGISAYTRQKYERKIIINVISIRCLIKMRIGLKPKQRKSAIVQFVGKSVSFLRIEMKTHFNHFVIEG